MQDFGKSEDMTDMKRTKIMMEVVVYQCFVNSKEDRPSLCLRCFSEKAQIETFWAN